MENKHLLKPREVGELSRPCDTDDMIVERAIEEAELLDIKPRLGDELFLHLLTHTDYSVLLNGGEYRDESGGRHVFAGLKRTLAYYVWARCVKTGTGHLTRFGYVEKQEEHSVPVEYKQQQVAYKDAFATADGYMKECLDYMQANPGIFADYTSGGQTKTNRVIYKIIGE